MDKNKKLSAYPDREQTLKGTNFKSKKLKMTRKQKLQTIIYLEIGLFIALFFVLSDLTAQKVANALYPSIKPVEANFEPQKSIEEHICLATNGENCEVLVNLARCESSLNKDAYHINTNRTVDLGLFQINSVHYQKEDMSAVCALDVYCSARWANEQIKKGNGHIWVCWNRI